MTAITGLAGEQGWAIGGDMAELTGPGLYPETWGGAGAGGYTLG